MNDFRHGSIRFLQVNFCDVRKKKGKGASNQGCSNFRWKFGEGYATLVAFRVKRMCVPMLLKFIVYVCARIRTHTHTHVNKKSLFVLITV